MSYLKRLTCWSWRAARHYDNVREAPQALRGARLWVTNLPWRGRFFAGATRPVTATAARVVECGLRPDTLNAGGSDGGTRLAGAEG